MADHDSGTPRITKCEHAEPRADGSQYLFSCHTTLTPVTNGGVHEINDRQVVEEVVGNALSGTQDCRGIERCAVTEQGLDSSRINFHFRFAGSGNVDGSFQERETKRASSFDETFEFQYDFMAALGRIGAWQEVPDRIPTSRLRSRRGGQTTEVEARQGKGWEESEDHPPVTAHGALGDGGFFRFSSSRSIKRSLTPPRNVFRLGDVYRERQTHTYADRDEHVDKTRQVDVKQTIDGATFCFSITFQHERQVHGQETEIIVQETYNFTYDMHRPMMHQSGWFDKMAEARRKATPARALASLPAPPTQLGSVIRVDDDDDMRLTERRPAIADARRTMAPTSRITELDESADGLFIPE